MIGSNIYWKKTWQNTTINKGNCTFSVVFSLLRWRVKHIYLKISLKFLEICTKHAICLGLEIFLQFYFDSFKLLRWQKPSAKKCYVITMILLFMSAIMVAFAECWCELKRLNLLKLLQFYHIFQTQNDQIELVTLVILSRFLLNFKD